MITRMLYPPLPPSQISTDCCTSCDGAASPKAPLSVACSCAKGQFRDPEDGSCEACGDGEFAAGGEHLDGTDWLAWNQTRRQSNTLVQPAPGVILTCEGSDGCNTWSVDGVGDVISSGNNYGYGSLSSTMVLVKDFSLDSGNGGRLRGRSSAAMKHIHLECARALQGQPPHPDLLFCCNATPSRRVLLQG